MSKYVVKRYERPYPGQGEFELLIRHNNFRAQAINIKNMADLRELKETLEQAIKHAKENQRTPDDTPAKSKPDNGGAAVSLDRH